MTAIRSLLNRLPHRRALLRLLGRELTARGVSLPPYDLERLRENLLQYPKRERPELAAALAELLGRVHGQGALFVPREQDGYWGRKWSAGYADAFIAEEAGEWLRQVREIRARAGDYTVALEPGRVAVSAGPTDSGGELPEGYQVIETAWIEKLPVVVIAPEVPRARA